MLRAAAGAAVVSGCAVDDNAGALSAEVDEVVAGGTVWVSPTGDDAQNGRSASRAKRTIQAALTALGAGGDRRGTVRLMPGEYTGTIDISGFRHLRVVSQRPGEAVVHPATTLGWNVASYGETRRTPVRVVDSEDVVFRGVAFDFETVRADFVAGVLVWDSTGSFEDGSFKNMSAAGYYELTAYVSAPSFSADRRAEVSFTGNDFVRTGRVGVILHGWTRGTIARNAFRTEGDFGYGIEVGSQATADIRGNDIAGYNTPAATDGSASAGIYIDNAFTAGAPHADKSVLVRANHVHENSYGLSIGNGFPGLSGDVDIAVRLEANLIHGNDLAGVFITDEGRAAGSSVTVTARGNVVHGTAHDGYLLSTAGDGELHVDVTGDTITGNESGVTVLADAGASLHDVSVRGSTLRGNTAWGVRNLGPSVVDARNNWWGSEDGPADATGAVEVTARTCEGTPQPSRLNAVGESSGAVGDASSDAVDYCGWRRRGP